MSKMSAIRRIAYEARLRASAREIARGGNKRIPGVIPDRIGLAGLGCDCQVNYTGGRLRGYREALLHGTIKTQLNGLAQGKPEGTPALIPVSDRKAVTAAVRLFKGLKP